MASILDRFFRFLERAERSPLTLRVYRSDLEGMAKWFEAQNGDPFSPAKITPTDLRDYKRWLAGQHQPETRQPRGFQILLAPYVRAAGLKDVTPHSLRHSFCKNRSVRKLDLHEDAIFRYCASAVAIMCFEYAKSQNSSLSAS